jgi:hypothetical protein
VTGEIGHSRKIRWGGPQIWHGNGPRSHSAATHLRPSAGSAESAEKIAEVEVVNRQQQLWIVVIITFLLIANILLLGWIFTH